MYADTVRYCRDLTLTHLLMCKFAADDGGTIGISHLLKALYVADLERMLVYWESWRNWESIEKVVARNCGLAQPRWYYWIELYQVITGKEVETLEGVFFPNDVDMMSIHEAAADIVRKKGATCIGLKELLFAVTTKADLVPVRELLATGLDLQRLRTAAEK